MVAWVYTVYTAFGMVGFGIVYVYIIYVGWAYTLSTLPVIWWVGHTYTIYTACGMVD